MIRTITTTFEQEGLGSQAKGMSGITTADAFVVKNWEQSPRFIYVHASEAREGLQTLLRLCIFRCPFVGIYFTLLQLYVCFKYASISQSHIYRWNLSLNTLCT